MEKTIEQQIEDLRVKQEYLKIDLDILVKEVKNLSGLVIACMNHIESSIK